jgi:hypothetical protein
MGAMRNAIRVPAIVLAIVAAPLAGYAQEEKKSWLERQWDSAADAAINAVKDDPAGALENGMSAFDWVSEQFEDSPDEEVGQLTKDEVKQVQERLNALGFNSGHPDGIMGNGTRRAIGQFQARRGEQATGKLTSRQLRDLLA